MANASFHIAETRGERVVVQLLGRIDRAVATDALYEARTRFAAASTVLGGLLVDLTGVDDYDEDSREPMLDLHGFWKPRVRRSAYLADMARVRGLALWVLHMSGDENARSVMNAQQAEEWLRGSRGRVEDARKRTLAFLDQVEKSLGGVRTRTGEGSR